MDTGTNKNAALYHGATDSYCVCCGCIVPEGRSVCAMCEHRADAMCGPGTPRTRITAFRRFLRRLFSD